MYRLVALHAAAGKAKNVWWPATGAGFWPHFGVPPGPAVRSCYYGRRAVARRAKSSSRNLWRYDLSIYYNHRFPQATITQFNHRPPIHACMHTGPLNQSPLFISSFDALPAQLERDAGRRSRSSPILVHCRLQQEPEGARSDRHEAHWKADEGAGLEDDAAVQEHEGQVHGLCDADLRLKRREL